MNLGIVGAGWAGLAAAVDAVQAGHTVSVLEMAATPGGRARRTPLGGPDGLAIDNGQHILIGAYTECLRLLSTVGVDASRALLRRPLVLRHADGRGLELSSSGPPWWAFTRGVMTATGWTASDKLSLLRWASRQLVQRFRCAPELTVDDLCAALPVSIRTDLIDPLCVAALNTPARQASAQVWLTVLHDALFSGRGASDLLLPRWDLGRLFPEPAVNWLTQHGARWFGGSRVTALHRKDDGRWALESSAAAPAMFDAVILATSPWEAARLARPHNPQWCDLAAALQYEPIISVMLQAKGRRLAHPMIAMSEGPQAPAQILFDLGQVRDTASEPGGNGCFVAVISGARAWLDRGLEATERAVQLQVEPLLGPTALLHTLAEKRATFQCSPGLIRPAAAIAPGLFAAGDYLDGPYPATLEGAVRHGAAVARALGPVPPSVSSAAP